MKRAWALALAAGLLVSCAGGGSKGKTEGAKPAAYVLDAAGSQLSAAVLKNESKTVTVRYVGGMFPNQAGTEGKRTVSVTGDELKVSNPATASGMKSESVYRRATTVASR